MERRILMLVSESFPYGKAYAARTRALIKIFDLVGFETTVLCDEKSNSCEDDEYHIITCEREKFNKISRLFLYPQIYSRKMDELLKRKKYDLVITRSMFDRFSMIQKVAKSNNVPLIVESCECYDKLSFSGISGKFRYLQFKNCWNHQYNKADGYIVISRFLEKHYKTLNKPIIRIPAILNTERKDFSPHVEERETINLIYGGDITGKKELMGEIFKALSKIDTSKRKYSFNIFGPSEKQVIDNIDEEENKILQKLKKLDIVKIHGRVPQDEMFSYIGKSDYGIFIRPQRISSEAGFPTKMGEYLSAGLPVITNNTGDISLVLRDGYNGFIVCEPIEENLHEIFNNIQKMTQTDIRTMSQNARESAEKCLDPKIYVEVMREFLSNFS